MKQAQVDEGWIKEREFVVHFVKKDELQTLLKEVKSPPPFRDQALSLFLSDFDYNNVKVKNNSHAEEASFGRPGCPSNEIANKSCSGKIYCKIVDLKLLPIEKDELEKTSESIHQREEKSK